MVNALLLALLLPVAQEDPQVTYREGLFEEVDQGNLEKAVELYAKILNSSAPDALKAKALFRTGSCHEKKGQRKEAEQAWRDVIERFPGAAETVKLARERLTRPDGEGEARTQDEQIQKAILGLGSNENLSQAVSMRTLTLLGEPAVSQLRRALQHKDRTLSGNAALVLFEMGLYEGLYDSLRRFWLPRGEPAHQDYTILPRLLKEGEADRKRFLKDVEGLKATRTYSYLTDLLCSLPEPEFSKIVEDWIVERENIYDDMMRSWASGRAPAEILRVMKRLADRTPPSTGKILSLFKHHAGSVKAPDTALKAEVLAAMSREKDTDSHFPSLMDLAPSCGATDVVRGPLATWFSRGSVQERRTLLARMVGMRGSEEREAVAAECRKFVFEHMADASAPLEMKELIVASGYRPDSPEEFDKYLEFCLQYWKERRVPRDGKKEPAAKGHAKMDTMLGVLHTLAFKLPADSKELPAVLDDFFDTGWMVTGKKSGPDPDRRKHFVEAALRTLSRDTVSTALLLEWIQNTGTIEEKLGLGPLLPKLGATNEGHTAGWTYASSCLDLPEAGLETQWKELVSRFEAGSPSVKTGIVQALHGHRLDMVDQFMKAQMTSLVDSVRAYAIGHWAERNTPEALALVMSALQDQNVDNQIQAVRYVRSRPALESVPGLIKILNSPSKIVREEATLALNEIKKHFEAQAEWKRWYDETKKALGK